MFEELLSILGSEETFQSLSSTSNVAPPPSLFLPLCDYTATYNYVSSLAVTFVPRFALPEGVACLFGSKDIVVVRVCMCVSCWLPPSTHRERR